MEPLPRHISLGCVHETTPQLLRDRIAQARLHGIRSVHAATSALARGAEQTRQNLESASVELDAATLDRPDPTRPEAFTSTVWLASVNDAGRAEAMGIARQAAAAAAAVGARTLLIAPGPIMINDGPMRHAALVDDLRRGNPIEPDTTAVLRRDVAEIEEHGLDRTCRSLFELCREFPGIRFCLLPGSTCYEIPQLHHVELVLSDVGAANLGYWHDPGRCQALAAQGFGEPSEWLERYKTRMLGMSLHDGTATESGLIPGAGTVDLAMLGDYSTAATRVTIDASPDWGDEGIRHSIACLQKHGFLNARCR